MKKYIPYAEDTQYLIEDIIEGEKSYPINKQKHVGVELECFLPRNLSREMLVYEFINNGIESGLDVKGDGSINPPSGYRGHEIAITAPEKDIVKKVTKACQILKKLKGGVNKTCGLHVHLDTRTRNKEKVYKILVDKLPTLSKMVAKHRLKNRYCVPNGPYNTTVDHDYSYEPTYDYEPSFPEMGGKYNAINGCTEYDTVEVRLHEGTLDNKKINKWIKTLTKIVNKAA